MLVMLSNDVTANDMNKKHIFFSSDQFKLCIFLIFLVSLWLIVIHPLGPNLSRLPGDLGDSRFNNYILEHDFRWTSGKEADLFSPDFFYPHSLTLAFSDTHLGSMLFYSIFRWLGLNRELAFQAWYLLSFLLNFYSALFVLKKYEFCQLSILLGSFFFTFGLPVLAQENHVQLTYRFCIPLACYCFFLLIQKPSIKRLAITVFWLVWQFYLSIYLGYFLTLLLLVVALVLPFKQKVSYISIYRQWINSFKDQWKCSSKKNNFFYSFIFSILLVGLVVLFIPYAYVTKTYGFIRSWGDVLQILPKPISYIISDGSSIWRFFAFLSNDATLYRDEHNLFIGLASLILLVIGLVWRFNYKHRKYINLFIIAVGILILLTININGFSLYGALWYLPGVNSIRAVSRIILVFMWPIALYISSVVDALSRSVNRSKVGSIIGLILFILMYTESVFYDHRTFTKLEAESRSQKITEQIPAMLPDAPILFVWYSPCDNWYLYELDAMLIAQELDWPVLNGYSANFPIGYGPTTSCEQAIIRINDYLATNKITDPIIQNTLISRIVTIGPESCKWREEVPMLTQ